MDSDSSEATSVLRLRISLRGISPPGVVQNACFWRYTDELNCPAFSGGINM